MIIFKFISVGFKKKKKKKNLSQSIQNFILRGQKN